MLHSLVLTCDCKSDLKLKVRTEFSNVWGEYKYHGNPYIQVLPYPVMYNVHVHVMCDSISLNKNQTWDGEQCAAGCLLSMISSDCEMGRTVGFRHCAVGHLGHVQDVLSNPGTVGWEQALCSRTLGTCPGCP